MDEKEIAQNSRVHKTFLIIFIILNCALFIGIGSFLNNMKFKPKYVTSIYHANMDYDMTVAIQHAEANVTIPALMDMYDRHADWKYSLEVPADGLEVMYEYYPDKFKQLKTQVDEGRCELICFTWALQLAGAFPGTDLIRSMNYTKGKLAEWNITASSVLFFQEGQVFPGIGEVAELGFKTLLIGSHTLDYYRMPVDSPLFKLNYQGNSFNLLTYNYIPMEEAGYIHIWGNMVPMEHITGKYDVNEDNIAFQEWRFEQLEEEGYTFLTCEEWVDICLKMEATKELPKYFPESNWRTKRGVGLTQWMGKDRGAFNDDGDQLATVYRTRGGVEATERLFNYYRDNGAITNQTIVAECEEMIEDAWNNIYRAQSTDNYGWGPTYWEVNCSYYHSLNASLLCRDVINLMNSNLTEGLPTNIMVDLSAAYEQQIITNVEDIQAKTRKITGEMTSTSSEEPGFSGVVPFSVDYTHDDTAREDSKLNITTRSEEIAGIKYEWVQVEVTNIVESFVKFQHSSKIKYSPTLHEDILQEVNYWDYGHKILLPISNGLIYSDGWAIIQLCGSRHTGFQLDVSKMGYHEHLEELKRSEIIPDDFDGYWSVNHTYEFICAQVSEADAIILANQINAKPAIQMYAGAEPWSGALDCVREVPYDV